MHKCLTLFLLIMCLPITALAEQATQLSESVYLYTCSTSPSVGALGDYICNPARLTENNQTVLGVWRADGVTQVSFQQPNQNGVAGGVYATQVGGEMQDITYVVAVGPWSGASVGVAARYGFGLNEVKLLDRFTGDVSLHYVKGWIRLYGVYTDIFNRSAEGHQPKLRLGTAIEGKYAGISFDRTSYNNRLDEYVIGALLRVKGLTLKTAYIDPIEQPARVVYAGNLAFGILRVGATVERALDKGSRVVGSIGFAW